MQVRYRAAPRPDRNNQTTRFRDAISGDAAGRLRFGLFIEQRAQLLELFLHTHQHVARLRIAERNLHLLDDRIGVAEILLQLLARAVDGELLLVEKVADREHGLDIARTIAAVAGAVLL